MHDEFRLASLHQLPRLGTGRTRCIWAFRPRCDMVPRYIRRLRSTMSVQMSTSRQWGRCLVPRH